MPKILKRAKLVFTKDPVESKKYEYVIFNYCVLSMFIRGKMPQQKKSSS